MRALFRSLSVHTVFSPIETIVFVFVLSTLAYFHILDGIKHSSFFEPTFPSTLRPAHVRLVGQDWVGAAEREWYGAMKLSGGSAVELQQLVFVMDDRAKKVSLTCFFHSQTCKGVTAARTLCGLVVLLARRPTAICAHRASAMDLHLISAELTAKKNHDT